LLSPVNEQPSEWAERLGRKVSIRYLFHDDAHPFSEAIGVVMSVSRDEQTEEIVEIMNRRGEVVSVRASDIVAVKEFPTG
jgi:hypothetical protein